MGGIFETGLDIFFFQMGLILKDLAFSDPGGKKLEDKLDGYSRPLDDRFPP
jgi:hypothetical protein